MSKLTLWLLIVCYTFALESNYFIKNWYVKLPKDQEQQFLIDDEGTVKKLKFRWTLFVNKGLVVLANYNGFPSQYMVYQEYNRDTIKIKLSAKRKKASYDVPYLLIRFAKFDYGTKQAEFDIYFRDAGETISVDLLDNKSK